jgi:HAD superfamily hydrolase (TIGR01549 family)
MRRALSLRPVLRGIIFDMDGTLTSPNLDFNRMYERCGVPLDEDLLAAIAKMAPERAARALAVVEEMEEEGRRTLQLLPGAIELARWLGERGVRTALVTRNSSRTVDHFQRMLWQPAGIPALAPALSRDDDIGPPKPDPTVLRAIAAHWDVPLGDGLLMIGDSPKNDVLFGKAAGVATALVDSGRRYIEATASATPPSSSSAADPTCGADFVVGSLAELPALLERTYRTRVVSAPAQRFEKQPTPVPADGAASAAASGDVGALAAMPTDALLAPDGSGNTPLVWAANAGRADAVRLLLDAGADPNACGYLGATALSRACRWGHAHVISLLLGRAAGPADPEVPNDQWQYPLHFAAFKRQPEAVRLLLAHGASTTVTDRKGRTPDRDTSDEAIRAAIVAAREARVGAYGMAPRP